jgi:hypothetical protein
MESKTLERGEEEAGRGMGGGGEKLKVEKNFGYQEGVFRV